VIAAIDCVAEDCFGREADAENILDDEGFVLGVTFVCGTCGLLWIEMFNPLGS